VAKRLFIFPGMGSPLNEQYKKVYNIIIDEAIKLGYKKIELLSWPGHSDAPQYSLLNQSNAFEIAKKKVMQAETEEEPYKIIGTSFGCLIALRILTEFADLKYLKSTVIWGIVPYWLSYYYFYQRIEESIKRVFENKDTRVDPQYFEHHVPIEVMLHNYKINKPLTVAIGEFDKHTKPSYIQYLSDAITNQNITFKVLKNVEHSVRKYTRDYLEMLFEGDTI